MTAPARESTAVAKTEKASKLHPIDQARIDEARQRNALVAAVRGTIWGEELNETAIRAVAQYCRENNLDAVRHVEVLGGRIYLTAGIAETDARGRLLTREGEIIIGHYGQTRWWERGFRFEGSPFPAVYDELRRDHRTPGGWREMASWQHVFEAATRRAA